MSETSASKKRPHDDDDDDDEPVRSHSGIPVTDFLAGMRAAAPERVSNQKLRLLQPEPSPLERPPDAGRASGGHGGIPVATFLARHKPEGAGVAPGARLPRAVVDAILEDILDADGSLDAAELISRVRRAAAREPEGYRMDVGDDADY